jgi:hypothetical protein
MNDENERKCASCGALASNPCGHLRNEGHASPALLAAVRAQLNPPILPAPSAPATSAAEPQEEN